MSAFVRRRDGESGYGKVGGFLDRIDKAFDWPAFEALLAPIHASIRGAPGYPPLVMFKILLVQQWHTLTDPGAEEAVRDRLSFRRFCGLPLEAETPDHTSIWRFRQTIDKLGLSAALLLETNRQLDGLGLVVKHGTLADATLIEAAVKRSAYGSGGVNPRDPDARVTMKRKTVHFGYKAHLAVDEESGLVRQAEMTPAHVHDSRLAEALIQDDEPGYFADKAYSGQAFRETLERRGLVDGVAWRGRPHHPLEPWRRLMNAGSSRPVHERAPGPVSHSHNGPRPEGFGLGLLRLAEPTRFGSGDRRRRSDASYPHDPRWMHGTYGAPRVHGPSCRPMVSLLAASGLLG